MRLAQCEAWVEIQGAIYEGNSWIDVRLEVAEDLSHVAEDIGIVARSLKRSASKIDAVLTVSLRIRGLTARINHLPPSTLSQTRRVTPSRPSIALFAGAVLIVRVLPAKL